LGEGLPAPVPANPNPTRMRACLRLSVVVVVGLSSKLVRGVRVIDRYLSSYILYSSTSSTSTRTNDDDDEDRRKTGHGRCPIRFEYGAGAAAGRSRSLRLLTLPVPPTTISLSHHTLSFWHAGECAILFLYCLNYLHTSYCASTVDKQSKQAPASIYPFFTRLQDDSPAIACAFYRLPTFCMPLQSAFCLSSLQPEGSA
jgi:hypothetical protein